MNTKWFHSTFTKMTAFFICFGMIPLVLISMTFFYWYRSDVMQSAQNNYSEIADYAQRNISALIEKADGVAGYLYNYSTEEYEYLYEILEDDSITEVERQIYINRMLQDMLLTDPDISSIRFYREDGTCYMSFRVQGKNSREDDQVLNRVEMTQDNYHKMILMPAQEESLFYTNTEDSVFTVVRSYMKTETVASSKEECLGALYIDINVSAIEKLVDNIDVGNGGKVGVCNPSANQWIYTDDKNWDSESFLTQELADSPESRIISHGQSMYFCRQISDTGYYVIIRVMSESVMDTYIKNRTYIMAILIFVILLLALANTVFSGKMNGPVKKLTLGMQQVQKGNLQTRVDIHTNDEMEYLGEGFNKMVDDLTHYIEEVYVANVCQKEAELNALKMQIQPHYLYNTLDVIRMTALENNDRKTARLLEGLGKQLRYVIGKQQERVPLYMEVDSIREYVVLMNARYQDKFQLNVNVSDADRNLYILKLVFQPVIENSIKHGLRDKEGMGTIDISVKRCQDYLEIIIMDDGNGMTEEEVKALTDGLKSKEAVKSKEDGHVSLGLKNVYDRIKFTCGEDYGFTVTSMPGMGTMVKYRLPIWEEDTYVEADHS